MGEFNAQRGETGALAALKSSKDPALFTVVLEDLAAVIGLIIALAGNLLPISWAGWPETPWHRSPSAACSPAWRLS